jgi:hypothetical protein
VPLPEFGTEYVVLRSDRIVFTCRNGAGATPKNQLPLSKVIILPTLGVKD